MGDSFLCAAPALEGTAEACLLKIEAGILLVFRRDFVVVKVKLLHQDRLLVGKYPVIEIVDEILSPIDRAQLPILHGDEQLGVGAFPDPVDTEIQTVLLQMVRHLVGNSVHADHGVCAQEDMLHVQTSHGAS